MKKTLIDTNILYALAGIDDKDSNIDAEILRKEILKLGDIVVSEISLFELYTHKGFSIEDRKKVMKYIEESHIPLVNCFPDKYSFFAIASGKNHEKRRIRRKILKAKIQKESEVLKSAIPIVASIFYVFLTIHISDNDVIQAFERQTCCVLEGNFDFVFGKSYKTLMEFYKKGLNPKQDIEKIIDAVLYGIFLNYQLSLQGLNINEIKAKKVRFVEDKSIPLYEIKSKICKHKNGILCKKDLYWNDLEKSIEIITDYCEKNWNPEEKNYISYYCHYARMFFEHGKKFDKNNLFDSLFHFFDSAYSVYTLDEFLTETYKGASHYGSLQSLQTKIKK